VDGAHDRGVADRAIVDEDAVDGGHGVEQPARLDLFGDLGEWGFGIGKRDVVIEHSGVVAVATLDLSAYDRRDLLRRPGRASSTREALCGGGDVVYLDQDGSGHVALL